MRSSQKNAVRETHGQQAYLSCRLRAVTMLGVEGKGDGDAA